VCFLFVEIFVEGRGEGVWSVVVVVVVWERALMMAAALMG
jgi:hypothetical protein